MIASTLQVQRGRYRHFKGKCYEVIGIAKHTETDEALVIYRALYGDQEVFARPAAAFCEAVMTDGRLVQRFEYLGSSED